MNRVSKEVLLLSLGLVLSGCAGTTPTTSSSSSSKAESSTSFSQAETSSEISSSTTVSHKIEIDGDFDLDNPVGLSGTSLELCCYVDDNETSNVTWGVSDDSIASISQTGILSFKNVLAQTSVTVSATSLEFTGLVGTVVFTVNPCVIDLLASRPTGEITYNQAGTSFSVPKKQSALIYSGISSSSYYVEATFSVTDRASECSRIGIMCGEDEEGYSLDGVTSSLFFYIHIPSDQQDKTTSRFVGVAKTNSSFSEWEVVEEINTGVNFYRKGYDCTMGVLRNGQEFIFFIVVGGEKNAVGKYKFEQIGEDDAFYSWLGTSHGNDLHDQGKIAYDAHDLKALTGQAALDLYEEYKGTPFIGELPITYKTTTGKTRVHTTTLQGGYDYVVKYEGTLLSPSTDWGQTMICNMYEEGKTVDQSGFSFRGDWCGSGSWENSTYVHFVKNGNYNDYPSIKPNCTFVATYVYNDSKDYVECYIDYEGAGKSLQSYQRVSKVTYSGNIVVSIGLTASSVEQTIVVKKFTKVSQTPVGTKPTQPDLPKSVSTKTWNSSVSIATMDCGNFEVSYSGHIKSPGSDQNLGSLVAEVYSPSWYDGGATMLSNSGGWGPWIDRSGRSKWSVSTNPSSKDTYRGILNDCDFTINFKLNNGTLDVTLALSNGSNAFSTHHRIVEVSYSKIMVLSVGIDQNASNGEITVNGFALSSGTFLY